MPLRFDGKEALECLADKRFDLMILDIMLPKEDGFSVMRQGKGAAHYFPHSPGQLK